MSAGILNRLRLAVEIVTGVSINSDGLFTAKGADDHEIEGPVGWQFGFYSRNKGGINGAVVKADGQGNTAFLVCYRDKQYELSLKEGEVGIKNAFDASVLLDENGAVIVTPKDGQKVQLAGTDYAAPKWDDWLTYFDAFLVKLKADLTAGSGGGCTTTCSDTLAIAVPAGLKSSKVSNG